MADSSIDFTTALHETIAAAQALALTELSPPEGWESLVKVAGGHLEKATAALQTPRELQIGFLIQFNKLLVAVARTVADAHKHLEKATAAFRKEGLPEELEDHFLPEIAMAAERLEVALRSLGWDTGEDNLRDSSGC